MRKLLFNTIICAVFASSSLFAQNASVPIVNYSFSDPAYTGKIKSGMGIPGWQWAGTVADAGREAAKLRTSTDSLHAYVHNQDPKMYQVLKEVIGSGSVTYKLSYLGYADWTSNEAATMRTYFGAKVGSSIKLIDSIDNPLTASTWKELTHTFTLPVNSSYAGDSLVIGFNIVIPTATNGAWGDIDSITLAKTTIIDWVPITNYSFSEPAYTGKIKSGTGIPGWQWDGTVADAGREAAKLRTSTDSLHAYVHNQDPKMYQVLKEVIGISSVSYKLSYLGYADWTSNEAATMRTYFGAKVGSSIILLDSIDNPLTASTWKELTHTFTLLVNSSYAGDSLVIGFNIVIPTATNGAWGDIDSITLTKTPVVSWVPLTNYSFSDPAYTGKIKSGTGIPGWQWAGTVADAGREAAKLRTSTDSLHAYVHNQDPKMYQVLPELIGAGAVTYKLGYLGYADWTSNEAATMRTYFGAKTGSSITLIDSIDNPLTANTWKGLTHTYNFPANSAYVGDSLVIGFNIVIPTATNGAWGDIDSVTLVKEYSIVQQWSTFAIATPIFGKVPSSYNASVKMRWDKDSVYMFYNIVDDSVVSSGTAYQVDNLELYLDMANSKRIHWPRNQGWTATDTTFKAGVDYQFRVIPGIAWASVGNSQNTSIKGVNEVYTRTAKGYSFEVNIPWDSLSKGFSAKVGTQIGFDVDASDQDVAPGDATRNQVSMNSLTAQIFNDPSLWATLELADGGVFNKILDTKAPTIPSNLVGTVAKAKVTFTWDPSIDNTVVQKYIVTFGTKTDTILAKKSGNTLTTDSLADGTYTFGVVAVDVYGNLSPKAAKAVQVTHTDVKAQTFNSISFSPNPANDVIKFNNDITDKAIVYIYNITGQLELTSSVTNGTVNISSLKSGLYMIKLSNNNSTAIAKLVKR